MVDSRLGSRRGGYAAAGLLALWTFSAVGVASAAEPRNLAAAKAEVRAYLRSGDYERDLAAVAAEAKAWLQARAAQRAAGERLAVVFDLDETLLSNVPYFKSFDFGWNDATWANWVATANAPAIEPVREVYRVARQLGLEVLFLTARPEDGRAGTEKNLQEIGCAQCAALVMLPEGDRRKSMDFKTAERRKFVEAGYVIIANLGDQESDLAGGFAERMFKLPNPFYRTD